MKKSILLLMLFIIGSLPAEDLLPVKRVAKRKFGLFQIQGVSVKVGDRLPLYRNVFGDRQKIGEVQVALIKGNGCAVKVLKINNGNRIQVGDLIGVPSQSSGTGGATRFSGGLAVRGSTLGYGGEFSLKFHPKWNARLVLNTGSYLYQGESTEDDMAYDVDLKLQSMALLFDFYPGGGRFHLSGGVLNNLNAIELEVRPTANITIGQKVYTPAEQGTVGGKIEFDKYVPYIGLGWGNAATTGFGWMFDIGMVYQNSPQVNLSATGMLEPTAEQDGVIAEALEGWKAYGVVSLGVAFRIF